LASVAFTVAAFLCGLLLWLALALLAQSFHCLRSCWFFGSNNLEILESTFKHIKKTYPDYSPKFKHDRKKSYLGAYYRIQQAGLLGNIPVLEALSEFFKNFVFAVLIWGLSLFFVDNQFLYEIILWYVGVFICVLIISAAGRHYTEIKIHHLVWEADYFLMQNSGSGARVRGQSLTKYGRYPIHKEGKIRYSAQHRAKAFDFCI
jgi:hypothetical protein